jgi:hypothetical protein
MLIYHPIYDINHAIYRILLLLETSVHRSFHWEQIKLLDFYLLFPHLLKDIRPLPASLAVYRKMIDAIPSPYELVPNKKRAFYEVGNLQNTAVHNLIAKELIDVDSFQRNVVRRTEKLLPYDILQFITNDELQNESWYKIVIDELPSLPFHGKDGLKARSGLLEYRYDA